MKCRQIQCKSVDVTSCCSGAYKGDVRKADALRGEDVGVIERMRGKARSARKVYWRKGLRKEWDDEGTLGASLGSLRKGRYV